MTATKREGDEGEGWKGWWGAAWQMEDRSLSSAGEARDQLWPRVKRKRRGQSKMRAPV